MRGVIIQNSAPNKCPLFQSWIRDFPPVNQGLQKSKINPLGNILAPGHYCAKQGKMTPKIGLLGEIAP